MEISIVCVQVIESSGLYYKLFIPQCAMICIIVSIVYKLAY